jgi:hypothetical protein
MLESEKRQKKKRTWLCSQDSAQSGCTRLSGAPSWLWSNWPLSGFCRRRTTKNHRIVRWCTGLSAKPTVGRAIRAWRVAEPTVWWGHWTVRCAPDSVRCANGSKSSTVGCASLGRWSAPDSEQCLSGGAPDCPVRHTTEGKDCLPRLFPTTPSYLGAIKGTPRRMEDDTKHSLIISKHQDFILARLTLCDINLSSFWVENSVCELRAQVVTSVRVWAIAFETCVCCFSLPYIRASLWSSFVGARGSKLWRFLANGI